MRHATSRQLHAYWDALRAGRAAPGRDEIDPAAIRGILASVFVLDVAAVPLPRSADATFRLSGTRLDALFGRTLRGSTFDRLWSSRTAALAGRALDTVIEGRSPFVGQAVGGPEGCVGVEFELVLLPLTSSGRFGGRVLGALSTIATPDWMGLRAAVPLDLRPPHPSPVDPAVRAFGRRPARILPMRPMGKGGPSATPRP